MGLFSQKRAHSLKSAARSALMDAAEAKGRRSGKRQEKQRAVKAGETANAAKISGIRGVTSGIIGTLLANQVRASTGKAGLVGVAAGLAFNMLLKRNPVGAVVFGGAILAHKAYKSGQEAQARRDSRRAMAEGASAGADRLPGKAAPSESRRALHPTAA